MVNADEVEASGPEKLPLAGAGTASEGPMEKRGRLLSGLLAVNILFLGSALVLSSIFNRESVSGTNVLLLLMALSAVAVGWMTFHRLAVPLVPHRDLHAGAIWLRGAVLLFGVCTILLDAFKVGYYLQFKGGARTVKVVYPIVEAIFISTQTFLLWFHSRDCLHVHRDATRCGLMVTLATNLVMWMTAVTDDSVHRELEVEQQAPHNGSSSQLTGIENISDFQCQGELCTIFQRGIVIMYPFSIEYCLISSTMLYIMWTNVGRTINHHGSYTSHRFRGYGLVLGPLLGVVAIIIGLFIFILYQIEVSRDPTQPAPFIQFYSFHIVLLSIMSLCSLAALAVHRWEEREVDCRENPSRSLDVVLLQVAALGQLCISYFSIVAIVSTRSGRSMDLLNLVYSLLIIIEHMLQNLFIIEGLHRQSAAEELCLSFVGACGKDSTINLQNLKEQGSLSSETEATVNDQADVSAEQNDTDDPPDGSSDLNSRKLAPPAPQSTNTLNWKRKFLKEISMFMIMSNLIVS
ncbi:proton channel OTOP3-like [Leucoraja erinacea]|uniref:proton channel OTOP3-like n=1 Tax=Leucoraja erinaceus TaxID=7782 RepID=UPI002455B453|nr:proton channel OTOP3-like [Leucoraja erinacea]